MQLAPRLDGLDDSGKIARLTAEVAWQSLAHAFSPALPRRMTFDRHGSSCWAQRPPLAQVALPRRTVRQHV